MRPIRHSTVRSGGVDLAVYTGGNPEGPTVLLVHGWPDTHRLWEGVHGLLERDYRLVSLDMRGCGASGDPGDVHGFRLELLGRDLLRVAEVVSPGRPVHVIAHDWGSVAAWEAVCEPDGPARIASLTSLSGPNIDHTALWLRGCLRRPSPRRLLAVAAQLLSSLYLWLFISPLARLFFARFGSEERWAGWLRRSEGLASVVGRHSETLVDDMVSGLRYYRANLPRLLLHPRERRTTVPVLQLAAKRDFAIRPASLVASDPWTQQLTRVDVPYGHWLPLGHPEVVAVEAGRFIEAVETLAA